MQYHTMCWEHRPTRSNQTSCSQSDITVVRRVVNRTVDLPVRTQRVHVVPDGELTPARQNVIVVAKSGLRGCVGRADQLVVLAAVVVPERLPVHVVANRQLHARSFAAHRPPANRQIHGKLEHVELQTAEELAALGPTRDPLRARVHRAHVHVRCPAVERTARRHRLVESQVAHCHAAHQTINHRRRTDHRSRATFDRKNTYRLQRHACALNAFQVGRPIGHGHRKVRHQPRYGHDPLLQRRHGRRQTLQSTAGQLRTERRGGGVRHRQIIGRSVSPKHSRTEIRRSVRRLVEKADLFEQHSQVVGERYLLRQSASAAASRSRPGQRRADGVRRTQFSVRWVESGWWRRCRRPPGPVPFLGGTRSRHLTTSISSVTPFVPAVTLQRFRAGAKSPFKNWGVHCPLSILHISPFFPSVLSLPSFPFPGAHPLKLAGVSGGAQSPVAKRSSVHSELKNRPKNKWTVHTQLECRCR